MLYAYTIMLYCIESNDHVTYRPATTSQLL